MARLVRRIPPQALAWNVVLWTVVLGVTLGALVHRAQAERPQVAHTQKAR